MYNGKDNDCGDVKHKHLHLNAGTQPLLRQTLQFKHRYRNDHYRQHLKRNHCVADLNNHQHQSLQDVLC